MMKYIHNLFFFKLRFFLLSSILFAHEGSVGGLIAGLSHPVLGLDHLLAMVSVGIVSFQLSGKAIPVLGLTLDTGAGKALKNLDFNPFIGFKLAYMYVLQKTIFTY